MYPIRRSLLWQLPIFFAMLAQSPQVFAQGDGVVDASLFRVWQAGPESPQLFRTDIHESLGYPLTQETRADWELAGTASTRVDLCGSSSMPMVMAQRGNIEFVDYGETVQLKLAWNGDVRTIYMDEDSIPEEIRAPELGQSFGFWDEGSLFVITRNIQNPFIVRPEYDLSDAAELVERFSVSADGARLEYSLSVTDEGRLTGTFGVGSYWIVDPDQEFFPIRCALGRLVSAEPNTPPLSSLRLETLSVGLMTADESEPALPEFWPIPRASAMDVLTEEVLRNLEAVESSLADIDETIVSALDATGYFERSYYAVPGGFALLTRLEQISEDGTPLPDDARWSVEVSSPRPFSLRNYMRALFFSDPGYFRVIAFVVTPEVVVPASETIDRDQALDIVASGGNILPPSIGSRPFTDVYQISAYIYEFEIVEGETGAKTRLPGRLPGRVHLQQAAILEVLQP